jgi:hypothetical protein
MTSEVSVRAFQCVVSIVVLPNVDIIECDIEWSGRSIEARADSGCIETRVSAFADSSTVTRVRFGVLPSLRGSACTKTNTHGSIVLVDTLTGIGFVLFRALKRLVLLWCAGIAEGFARLLVVYAGADEITLAVLIDRTFLARAIDVRIEFAFACAERGESTTGRTSNRKGYGEQ